MGLNTRREFLKQVGAGATALAMGAGGQRALAREHSRPNVVLFYFDDLDFDEIGEYDYREFPTYTGAKERGLFTENMNPWLAYFENPVAHTPHIDSLARDGVRFDRFYITSTICSPSRYSLLTGRYASRSPGVLDDHPPETTANVLQNAHMSPDEMSIARLFKRGGYRTGMVGKWHNNAWDGPYGGRVHGIDPEADPRDPEVAAKVREAYDRGVDYIRRSHGFDYVSRVYLQNKEALGIPKALQEHNMEWLVEGALEFIDANRDEPFFFYFASSAPHGWIGSGDFLNADPLATPAGMLDTPPRGMPSRQDTAERARAAGASGRLVEATWLDDGVGAILDRLDHLGLAENTIVLFISDHQNRGKRTVYEGARAPAMVRWPKGLVEPGRRSDALCANIDVLPTLRDSCGLPAPPENVIDGKSFLPILYNEPGGRDSLLLEMAYARAVVEGDWKYIALRYPPEVQTRVDEAEPNTFGWDGTVRRYEQDTRWDRKGDVMTHYGAHKDFPAFFERDQLYNLAEDPYEQRNLADDPEYADRVAHMKTLLEEHLAKLPHTFGEFKTA